MLLTEMYFTTWCAGLDAEKRIDFTTSFPSYSAIKGKKRLFQLSSKTGQDF